MTNKKESCGNTKNATFDVGELAVIDRKKMFSDGMRVAVWTTDDLFSTVGYIYAGDTCIITGESVEILGAAGNKFEMVPVITKIGQGWIVASVATELVKLTHVKE